MSMVKYMKYQFSLALFIICALLLSVFDQVLGDTIYSIASPKVSSCAKAVLDNKPSDIDYFGAQYHQTPHLVAYPQTSFDFKGINDHISSGNVIKNCIMTEFFMNPHFNPDGTLSTTKYEPTQVVCQDEIVSLSSANCH